MGPQGLSNLSQQAATRFAFFSKCRFLKEEAISGWDEISPGQGMGLKAKRFLSRVVNRQKERLLCLREASQVTEHVLICSQ